MSKREREIKKLDIERDEKAIKKKRKLRTAGRIVALVVVLAFVGVLVGINVSVYKAAERVWDENIGIEAGVPFKDVFTIFKGVKKADEKAIVTNAYGEEDLTGFYSNVKNKMFLDESFDLDVMKILGKVMGSDSSTGEQGGEVVMSSRGTYGYDYVYVYTYADGAVVESDEPLSDEELGIEGEDNTQEPPAGETGTGNSAFDDLLGEIKFDFSSLADYQGGRNILELSDKQLAAFINDALSGLGQVIPSMEELEKTLGCHFNDVIKIKQIIISSEVDKPESVSLKITLDLKLKSLVSGIVDSGKLPPIIKSLMPEDIFASVTVYPCDRTRAIQASINNMSEVNVDKVIRIADVVLKKTGSNTSISQMLVDVNSKVVDMTQNAQNIIPLSFVNSGSVNIYPIETLMKMMNITVSEEAFLTMIRDIKLPNAQSLGYDVYTKEIKERDTRTFIGEVSAKYGIDNSDGKIGEKNTISDVMNFAQGENILNSINLKSIDYSGEYVENNVKVGASYQALSNMLSSYVNEQGMLGTIKAQIVNMSSIKDGELSLDIEVDVAQMLGISGDSTMSQLIKQLIPQSVFATATITLDNSQSTSVSINKKGAENSQKHLQTLTAIATTFGMNVASLSYESICSQVDSGIKQGLAKVKEQIGYDIKFERDKAYLPSLYEVISSTSIINGDLQEGEHYFTPQELRNMLKSLYTFSYDEANDNFTPTDNMDGFIEQLYEKYFISDTYKAELQAASSNNNFLQVMTNIGGDNFMSKIRLDDFTDGDGKVVAGLKSSQNVTEKAGLGDVEFYQLIKDKFNPRFTLEETAYLIESQVNFAQTITFMKDVHTVYANNYSTQGDDYLELMIKGKGDVSNANATSLLPEYLYITIKIDLGQVRDGARTDMQVFQMDVNKLNYDRELGDGDKNNLQDLQLLLMLIDRVNAKATTTPTTPDPENPIPPEPSEPQPEPTPAKTTSIDSIIANIEEKLNGKKNEEGQIVETGFKDRIHNNVFTVAFIDNKGFMLEQTVYDIALNSIYNEDARIKNTNSDKPSEVDFRNAVCKINNMPDSVEINNVTVSLNGSNKKDAANAVDEINEKYALSDSNKLNVNNLTGVLVDIGNKAENYSTAIDGNKLTSDFADGSKKTLDNLRPQIEEGELLSFLEESVTITAQGYEDTQMLGLYIVGDKEMTIVYKSKIKTSDSNYAPLLPSDVAMIVTTDLTKLTGEDVCTRIVFNDLSESEANAIDVVRNKINPSGTGTPTGSANLKEANQSCSDNVKKSMKPLTDNMNLTFKRENDKGVMEMDGIYEIASAKVNEKDNAGKITAQGLKDTLEALFAGLDLQGYTGASKDITWSGIDSQEKSYNVLVSTSGVKGIIGDGNISHKIDINSLKSSLGMASASSGNALQLSQSALIAKGNSSFDMLRNSLGGRLSNSKDYLLLTLSADVQAAIGSKLSILPERMYITVYMDIDNVAGGTNIVYNNLTDGQMSTLASLMNANADGASGFTDSGNIVNVVRQLNDTEIISAGSNKVTLGMLFEAKKGNGGAANLIPIAEAGKDENVVVGVGALSFQIG
ncbi:MAG: hypothetical protein HDT32_03355 [Clostridiales bacterium]|nr:hypothetical protein [Clostridiales bacterium]